MATYKGQGITIVPTKTDLPNASDAPGIGFVNDYGSLFVSDGTTWGNEYVTSTFIPSIYSGTKSATTTIAGQSEAKATGAKVLKIENQSSTNSVYIGLGQSLSEAETNASTGNNNVTRFLVLPKKISYINISNYSFYSWLGNGATVATILTQGV
jgi:hypothetical protein